MQEITKIYLRKIAAKAKDISTHLPTERTTEQATRATKPLPSDSPTQQKQTDHPAPRPVEKSKKHRIPFVAFALLVVFTSLCGFALLNLRPIALADNMRTFDNGTPSDGTPESVSADQSVADLVNENFAILGNGMSGDECWNYNTFHVVVHNDDFCWDGDDFWWGARDITCIYNPKHTDVGNSVQIPINQNDGWHKVTLGDPNDPKDAPSSVSNEGIKPNGITAQNSTDKIKLNQNTCVNYHNASFNNFTSTCVSDNSSGDDTNTDVNDNGASVEIHAQVGGDDILCGNDRCTDQDKGNTDECGTPGGPQMIYDRFGCSLIKGTENFELNGPDPKYPHPNEVNAKVLGFPFSKQLANVNKDGSNVWDSEGIYINPTAYDPDGAIYLPSVNLKVRDIGNSNDRPTCNATNRWTCPGSDHVIVYVTQMNFEKDSNGHWQTTETTGNPDKVDVTIDHHAPTKGIDDFPNTDFNPKGEHQPGDQALPIYWVSCGDNGGWAFPCSDTTASNNMPQENLNLGDDLDGGTVDEGKISQDWLSGDYDPSVDDPNSYAHRTGNEPGHLEYTYHGDTVSLPGVQSLYRIMVALAYVLLAPVFILIGYHFFWASWTAQKHVGAMETFGRVILSVALMSLGSYVVSMLIDITNAFNMGLVGLHAMHAYPDITIGNQTSILTLTKQGETNPPNPRVAESFRAIVVPISRWGCAGNDFVAILGTKFWTDLQGFVPVFGGIAKFAENIAGMIDFAKHVGEFATVVFSIALCAQVFVRIILINYYILISPPIFACWGLPGMVGHNVVRSWAKGCFSLLLTQTVQLFVLATFPSLLPPFPSLPNDRFGILNLVFAALPRLLVLAATLQVPKLMGTQATKAMVQAGTVAAGVVVAAGGAAYHTV